MPLTDKGNKIMSAMKNTYGGDEGEKVFYASRNAGKITGVDPESKPAKVKKAKKNAEPAVKAKKFGVFNKP